MTQEQKDKLFKYLCEALPYGVMVNYGGYEGCDYKLTLTILQDFPIEDLKPYLRPMSSMTEEEKYDYITNVKKEKCIVELPILPKIEATDWLNKKMFDFRGLIPKGLAIEVTEDNNYYKY